MALSGDGCNWSYEFLVEFGTAGNTDFVVANNLPSIPTGANQYRSDGATAIPEGGRADGGTVVFTGTSSDPGGNQVKLQIELRQITETFTGTPTFESSLVNSGTQAAVTKTGLGSGSYKWRYRAMDALGAVSSWAEFGTAGNTDFIVPDNRPNIIFILTDDQDVESAAHMPKLQSLLVQQGITFGNFFVNVSLCAPSPRDAPHRPVRTKYSGLHSRDVGDTGFNVFHNRGEENSTIATWLKASGYQTGFVGKYLNDYPGQQSSTYVPPGWDEWYSPTGKCCSFYTQYNYTMNQNGSLAPTAAVHRTIWTMSSPTWQMASSSVRLARPGPFFLHITPTAPHVASATDYPVPAPRDANLFPGLLAPRVPSYNEADVSDKPAYIRALPLLTLHRCNTWTPRIKNVCKCCKLWMT